MKFFALLPLVMLVGMTLNPVYGMHRAYQQLDAGLALGQFEKMLREVDLHDPRNIKLINDKIRMVRGRSEALASAMENLYREAFHGTAAVLQGPIAPHKAPSIVTPVVHVPTRVAKQSPVAPVVLQPARFPAVPPSAEPYRAISRRTADIPTRQVLPKPSLPADVPRAILVDLSPIPTTPEPKQLPGGTPSYTVTPRRVVREKTDQEYLRELRANLDTILECFTKDRREELEDRGLADIADSIVEHIVTIMDKVDNDLQAGNVVLAAHDKEQFGTIASIAASCNTDDIDTVLARLNSLQVQQARAISAIVQPHGKGDIQRLPEPSLLPVLPPVSKPLEDRPQEMPQPQEQAPAAQPGEEPVVRTPEQPVPAKTDQEPAVAEKPSEAPQAPTAPEVPVAEAPQQEPEVPASQAPKQPASAAEAGQEPAVAAKPSEAPQAQAKPATETSAVEPVRQEIDTSTKDIKRVASAPSSGESSPEPLTPPIEPQKPAQEPAVAGFNPQELAAKLKEVQQQGEALPSAPIAEAKPAIEQVVVGETSEGSTAASAPQEQAPAKGVVPEEQTTAAAPVVPAQQAPEQAVAQAAPSAAPATGLPMALSRTAPSAKEGEVSARRFGNVWGLWPASRATATKAPTALPTTKVAAEQPSAAPAAAPVRPKEGEVSARRFGNVWGLWPASRATATKAPTALPTTKVAAEQPSAAPAAAPVRPAVLAKSPAAPDVFAMVANQGVPGKNLAEQVVQNALASAQGGAQRPQEAAKQ